MLINIEDADLPRSSGHNRSSSPIALGAGSIDIDNEKSTFVYTLSQDVLARIFHKKRQNLFNLLI